MNSQWWNGLTKLDDDQKKILDVNISGRYFISGPPGCGKTNLLVLHARRLALANIQNFKTLVYNGPLEMFLTSHPTYGIASNKIETFISWMHQQLFDIVGKKSLPDAPEERRAALCTEMRQYLESTGKRNLIDTILVDEVQDCAPDELRVLGMLAQNLFFVGDTRQQIYRNEVLSSAISELIPKENQIELKRHYRIGRNICVLADRITKPEHGFPRLLDNCFYPEADRPSSVRQFQGTFDEQVARTAKSITEQLDTYPGEFIGVMCPRRETTERVAAALSGLLPGKVSHQKYGAYSSFDSAKPVICSTMHNGKGLEFTCVHILECNGLKGMGRTRELAFTGITRAKTSLTISYSDELHPFLADALNADQSPPAAPTPDALFG